MPFCVTDTRARKSLELVCLQKSLVASAAMLQYVLSILNCVKISIFYVLYHKIALATWTAEP